MFRCHLFRSQCDLYRGPFGSSQAARTRASSATTRFGPARVHINARKGQEVALIVETGAGLPNADALMSVAFADTYHQGFGNTSWTGDEAAKEGAIRRATAFMSNSYSWQGAIARLAPGRRRRCGMLRHPHRPDPDRGEERHSRGCPSRTRGAWQHEPGFHGVCHGQTGEGRKAQSRVCECVDFRRCAAPGPDGGPRHDWAVPQGRRR